MSRFKSLFNKKLNGIQGCRKCFVTLVEFNVSSACGSDHFKAILCFLPDIFLAVHDERSQQRFVFCPWNFPKCWQWQSINLIPDIPQNKKSWGGGLDLEKAAGRKMLFPRLSNDQATSCLRMLWRHCRYVGAHRRAEKQHSVSLLPVGTEPKR